MESSDDELPPTMRNDQEVGRISAEREYVRQESHQEQRVEAVWRWSYRVDRRSFV